MTPEQLDDLIRAIAELKPSPMAIWIPALTGLGGAALGFGASLLKEWIERVVGRRRGFAAETSVMRRSAINSLNRDAVKWVDQWAGLQSNRKEHHESNRTIAAEFLITGVPADGDLQQAAVKYLDSLEESLFTYSIGSAYEMLPNRWSDEVHGSYRRLTTELSEHAERWLRKAQPARVLSDYMLTQIPILNRMRDDSIADRHRSEPIQPVR